MQYPNFPLKLNLRGVTEEILQSWKGGTSLALILPKKRGGGKIFLIKWEGLVKSGFVLKSSVSPHWLHFSLKVLPAITNKF